ncbi:pyridoxamine 5'-phosphate oxidase family protein [Streptomyces sp. NPDC046821]|uniref:helix-turn-helix domain-containing protein n=1 Tax=Streptomyces sp. NPDC046821 TaxID=3154702 RepID=UPI0033F529B8
MAGTPRASDGVEVQRSDFGRRVATRREALGLSVPQLAERVGASESYVRYVETQPARPGSGFVTRLADALNTTTDELAGGTYETPPGVADASRSPRLVKLSEEECRALLSTHGVGRIGLQRADGPLILPVNYTVARDGSIAFRTDPGTVTAAAEGQVVAFEVDRIDDAMSEGWSVLVVGPATAVRDPATARELAELAYSTPWAGGDRNMWLVVTPRRTTGRRVISSLDLDTPYEPREEASDR